MVGVKTPYCKNKYAHTHIYIYVVKTNKRSQWRQANPQGNTARPVKRQRSEGKAKRKI